MNFTLQQLQDYAKLVELRKGPDISVLEAWPHSVERYAFTFQNFDALKEREEFLRDIAITAVEGGIGYWSSCVKYRWSNTNDLDDMLPFPVIRIVPAEDPDDFKACDITQETILKGLEKMADPTFDINAESRGQIMAANVENDAGNIDADLADCIVQAGLFGELVFG